MVVPVLSCAAGSSVPPKTPITGEDVSGPSYSVTVSQPELPQSVGCVSRAM